MMTLRRRSPSRSRAPRDLPFPSTAMAGLALGMLSASLASSIANMSLPTLEADFAASFDRVQWVVLAYLVTMTAAMVFAGRFGDRLGRRRAFALGLALFSGASLAAAAAPSLGLVVVARALQGIGGALVVTLAVALVGEVVPAGRTGRAMGLLGTASALGTALGPSLGGALLEAFGWRGVFVAVAPFALGALALARRLPASPSAPGGSDAPFAALGAPLRDRRTRALLVANLLVSTVLMATLVVGPFHLSRALGLGPLAVGGVMTLGPAAAALFGWPAGRLVDRLGARRATLVGLVGILVGAALLALLPESLGVAGYVAPLVVTTSSYALFQAANNTSVMADVTADRRGVASGHLNLSRNLGLIAGTSLMGGLYAAAGLHVTFAVGAGLMLVALAIIARRVASSKRRGGWKVPAALLALSALPLLFGIAKLSVLSRGGPVTPDNARFFAAPIPVVVHIVGALLFSVLGAFQFASGMRRRWPRWHRVSGRVAWVGGVAVALTGTWMALTYPFTPAQQGPLLLMVRLIVGVAMAASLVLAITTIRRGDVHAHRAWTIRGYALGLGAATQTVLMLPYALAFGVPTHLPYEIVMTLAWVINAVVAERVIVRGQRLRGEGLGAAALRVG